MLTDARKQSCRKFVHSLLTVYVLDRGDDYTICKIRVIDAMMGRGKTLAASEYLLSHRDRKFIYATPYLSEVERICELCGFVQPESDETSKLTNLKHLLYEGQNISTTHSLLAFMDDDVMELIKEKHYSIIIDEELDVVERIELTLKDVELIKNNCVEVDEETCLATWIDHEYDGKFNMCKEKAEEGSLYCLGDSFVAVMNPELLRAFDEIIMMTYMFYGQYQRLYLDFFGFEYEIGGIDSTDGFKFTDSPDNPPPVDYHQLINIIDDPKLNRIGDARTALSKTWFTNRGRDSDDMKELRANMDKMLRCRSHEVPSNKQLWTTYKSAADKLYGPRGRYKSSFLQMRARATNAYKNRDFVLYMLNRFADPNIKKFFYKKGVKIDEEQFALSEMLQFIWRSAIRDNNPITLYIPSRRMRELLVNWIESVNRGNADE